VMCGFMSRLEEHGSNVDLYVDGRNVVCFVVASILGQYFLLLFMFFFYGFLNLINPDGRLVFYAKKLQSDKNPLLCQNEKRIELCFSSFCS
jgi:hypothetical protein